MSAKPPASAKPYRPASRQPHADAAVASLIKDARAGTPSGKRVMVIDAGGTSVKILASGQSEIRSFLNQLRALHMSDDAPRRGASFSSAFSIILSLARERIAELGCPPVGENPKAFVDRGGLSRLETEAAEAAIRRVREAAYPLIFKLFGSEMPRGKERKLVLARLGQDLARIEKTLGYRLRPSRDDAREQTSERVPHYRERKAAAKRRRR